MNDQQRTELSSPTRKQEWLAMNRLNDDANEIAALERLLEIASSDTGQSRKVANFLLAWWNAGTCGGFDLTDLWSVDIEISDDMITVIYLVRRLRAYPDVLGRREEFEQLVRGWRPTLCS